MEKTLFKPVSLVNTLDEAVKIINVMKLQPLSTIFYVMKLKYCIKNFSAYRNVAVLRKNMQLFEL